MKSIKLLWFVLALFFIAVGCEEKLTKPPKVTKPAGPTELTKSLLQAAADDDIDQVKSLISRCTDVNAQDDYGQTPLHCAAYKGYKNVAVSLLENGASTDPKDNAGRTPLHYAVGAGKNRKLEAGHADVVELLLDKGADINAKDKWGWTPLHFAARMLHKDMVELLVSRGADLNATNERGRTALSLVRGMASVYRGHPAESERASQYSDIADFLRRGGCAYYVATGGKDSNPGTLQRPFRTLGAAIDVTEQDDTIFVRGGLHSYSSTIYINKSGQKGKPICLRAYSGEMPVFDFSASKGCGFVITGAYWHINGLTVTGAESHGIQLETKEAHHNIIEHTTTHANGCNGIALWNGASHNLLINCDSYQNFDPETDGENADGFVAGRSLGKGNVLIGCRAWNNSDDGYDFGFTDEGVWLESCYAYRNGENIWGHPCFTGNANGFKLGAGNHLLICCVTWDHPVRGFKLQRHATGVTLYNCTGFRNRTNYQFILPTSNLEKNVLRNCLSFKGRIPIKPKVDDHFNSWNTPPGIEITEKDFLSLDDSTITGPRNPDGSLPESEFPRLSPGSDAIDVGTDLGLPFVGKAPDLGAFEYRPSEAKQSGIKWLHQTVRDHDIQKIHSLISEGTDVNEKDCLGYTPIHWAIYFGHHEVAQILISKGANPNIKSDTGRTPLEIATSMVYDKIAELLRNHGAKE